MEQPVFWSVLLLVAVLGAAVRWRNGGPWAPRLAVSVDRVGLVVAGVSVLALVLHCTVMFFAPWTDALPGARVVGDAVRGMGATSQWAYWVPAVALLVALRWIWWPGLAALAVTLLGVGVTMFWPFALTTHLAWLAAVILVGVVVSNALVAAPRSGAPGRRPAGRPA